jgi:hypothetical protein
MKPHSPMEASITAPSLLKPHSPMEASITAPNLLKPQDSLRPSSAPLIKEGGIDLSTQSVRDQKMNELNPEHMTSLEEDIIKKFGPLSSTSSLEIPTFKPVAAKLPASLFQ